MLSIIVAVAENNIIGNKNKLLWHISEDLKRFKRITSGHKIIMGRNTFLSLPKGALPDRTNIVITDKKSESFEGCTMAYSIEEALKMCENNEECFIIGGGMIYKEFYKLADKLYLTKVHNSFDGDTWFPEIKEEDWLLSDKEEMLYDEKSGCYYSFLTYEKQ